MIAGGGQQTGGKWALWALPLLAIAAVFLLAGIDSSDVSGKEPLASSTPSNDDGDSNSGGKFVAGSFGKTVSFHFQHEPGPGDLPSNDKGASTPAFVDLAFTTLQTSSPHKNDEGPAPDLPRGPPLNALGMPLVASAGSPALSVCKV